MMFRVGLYWQDIRNYGDPQYAKHIGLIAYPHLPEILIFNPAIRCQQHFSS